MLQLSLDLSVISGRCDLAPNSGINDLLWWWLYCSLSIVDVQRITLSKLLVNINHIFTKYRERGKWPNSVCDNTCLLTPALGHTNLDCGGHSVRSVQNYISHRPWDAHAAAADIFAAYVGAHSLIFSPRYLPRWSPCSLHFPLLLSTLPIFTSTCLSLHPFMPPSMHPPTCVYTVYSHI